MAYRIFCKNIFFYFQLTKFTKMNVWALFLYWSEDYPQGPNDRICRTPWKKEPENEPEEEGSANPPRN